MEGTVSKYLIKKSAFWASVLGDKAMCCSSRVLSCVRVLSHYSIHNTPRRLCCAEIKSSEHRKGCCFRG